MVHHSQNTVEGEWIKFTDHYMFNNATWHENLKLPKQLQENPLVESLMCLALSTFYTNKVRCIIHKTAGNFSITIIIEVIETRWELLANLFVTFRYTATFPGAKQQSNVRFAIEKEYAQFLQEIILNQDLMKSHLRNF